MTSDGGILIGPPEARTDFGPVLRLILVTVIAATGLVVLWQMGLLDAVIQTDHTRVSLIIFAVMVGTILHCFYQTVYISRELIAARRVRAILERERGARFAIRPEGVVTSAGTVLPPGVLTGHIAALIRKGELQTEGTVDQSLLLRLLADRLRSREKLGLFVSEALLRLALLGTAIGFILMLIPISALTSFETDTLRGALSGMTSGMAIALNVTVAGIAGALLLKLDYYLLDAAIAELFDTIVETTEIYVVSALEPVADARA